MSIDLGYVSLEELLDHVRTHPLEDGRIVPVCIWGPRGLGKTTQLRQYTVDRGIGLRVMQPAQMSGGSDLVGIPFIDQATRKTVYALPERLPKADDPDAERGGVLFLDEINRGSLEVLQGLMEVIGEGEIGQSGWKLPPGWMVVAAANPNVEGYDVRKMDDAMIGRMLHYSPGFNVAGWVRWARASGISQSVVSFVLQNPDLVDSGEDALPPEVVPTLNPRTAHYLAALYEDDMEPRLLRVIAMGLWGEDAAEEMLNHHQETTRPMSGAQVLAGGWDALLARWTAARRTDLMRASTEYMIALLSEREALPSKASLAAARWLAALPDSAMIEGIVSLSETAPRWLSVILAHSQTGLADRLPHNPNLIRRPAAREVQAQRLSRSEHRRQQAAQRAAQRRLTDAEAEREPAQVAASPPAPALPPALPPARPEDRGAPVAPRAPLRPIAPADRGGDEDEDMPFAPPSGDEFDLPDLD